MNRTLLSIPQAAVICALSRGTVWKYVKSGRLNASMTPGGQYRIHKDDLKAFMHRNKMHFSDRNKPERDRILIVDDDVHIHTLLKTILSQKGFHIEGAADGFEAGIKVMAFKPDLMILDLFMPGIDGFEVCKRIKADARTSHIKILALTGYDTLENRERIMALGADGYMTKPLDRAALFQSLNDLFENRPGVMRGK